MIFLADANSFYAACEELFRPDLRGRPIAVLSNNDGIIVSLNRACKELGLSRGDPYFKVRSLCEKNRVAVFSSNYTLYSDLSARLNLIYHRLAPEVEIYSIDESFLFFPEWKNQNFRELGDTVRRTALKETGIPVSVGVAPTKTLAKFCGKLAKNRGGVCVWDEVDQDKELAACPAGDIWGIGWSGAALLERRGVRTAFDLKSWPLHQAKKELSLTGYRTVRELNGIPAIEYVERETRQNITCSRSFSRRTSSLDEIRTALAEYTQEAVKRMREDRLACRRVSVVLVPEPPEPGGPRFVHASVRLAGPSGSGFLPEILSAALALLETIRREGTAYRKAMVTLSELEDLRPAQPELFAGPPENERREKVMKSFDEINGKFGRGTLHLAARELAAEKPGGDTPGWVMRREFLSPAYTTRLSDIPRVR